MKIVFTNDGLSADSSKLVTDVDVLVFAPHPDDAELFCGGTIAKFVNLGLSVVVADLSLGEMSSRGDVQLRMSECYNSSQILDISQRLNLELPDTEIGVTLRDTQLSKLVNLIRNIKPKLVILPYGDSRHPDHWRSRELLDEAMFLSNLPKKFEEFVGAHQPYSTFYYMMRETFEPSFVTDIGEYKQKKFEAISAFKSQVSREVEGHSTLVSDPLSLTSISARDSFYGSTIGVSFAEPFYNSSVINIENPFAHFVNAGSHKSFLFKNKFKG